MPMPLMNVYIVHRGQRHSAVALLTKRVPFNLISQKLFEKLFGQSWFEVPTPLIFYKGAVKIEINRVADLQVEIGKIIIKLRVYVSDEAMSAAMEPCDIIIGRETLEKYKIQVFE